MKTKEKEQSKKKKAKDTSEYEQMLIDFVKDEFKGIV